MIDWQNMMNPPWCHLISTKAQFPASFNALSSPKSTNRSCSNSSCFFGELFVCQWYEYVNFNLSIYNICTNVCSECVYPHWTTGNQSWKSSLQVPGFDFLISSSKRSNDSSSNESNCCRGYIPESSKGLKFRPLTTKNRPWGLKFDTLGMCHHGFLGKRKKSKTVA